MFQKKNKFTFLKGFLASVSFILLYSILEILTPLCLTERLSFRLFAMDIPKKSKPCSKLPRKLLRETFNLWLEWFRWSIRLGWIILCWYFFKIIICTVWPLSPGRRLHRKNGRPAQLMNLTEAEKRDCAKGEATAVDFL